jgi:hypothetical protein
MGAVPDGHHNTIVRQRPQWGLPAVIRHSNIVSYVDAICCSLPVAAGRAVTMIILTRANSGCLNVAEAEAAAAGRRSSNIILGHNCGSTPSSR